MFRVTRSQTCAEIGPGNSLGPNTVRTLGFLGLGEAYEGVAEVDKAGGLFFEWWDGIKDTKHGEVRPTCSGAEI
jgi:hypothetical protein